MSTDYTSAVGNPPAIDDFAAWSAWYNSLLDFRLAECPIARSTTHYIGQDAVGSDTGGGGSGTEGDPWLVADWDDAVTLIDNEIDTDTAFLLRRGDEFVGTTELGISIDDVTIGAWGSGEKPIINAFSLAYSSGWTLVSGTRYSRSEASDIAWVAKSADRFTAISRASDATGTGGLANNWFYWEADTLTIDIGTDPNAVAIEAVVSNAESGIAVVSDGSRVDNIQTFGWGCHRTSNATQAEGVHSLVTGTEACVFSDCESYYNSSHAMAHHGGNNSGGIWTAVNCKAGFTKYNGGAYETVFNSYAALGGHETILHDCETSYGTLPSSEWAGTRLVRGTSYFGHTNGTPASLYIAHGHQTPGNEWGAARPGYWNDAPAAAAEADKRSFSVKDFVRNYGIGGQTFSVSGGANTRYAPDWIIRAMRESSLSLSLVAQVGRVINGQITLDFSGVTGNQPNAWWTSSQASTIAFDQTHIKIIPSTRPLSEFYFPNSNNSAGSCDGCVFRNTILDLGSNDDPHRLRGFTNPADNFIACAHFGDIDNTDAGGGGIDLSEQPTVGEVPTAESELFQAGTEIGILRDFAGVTYLSPPNIGPLATAAISGGGSLMNPSTLKPGMLDADGNLKPGLVNSTYSGPVGDPSELRAGAVDGDTLKSGWLTGGEQAKGMLK